MKGVKSSVDDDLLSGLGEACKGQEGLWTHQAYKKRREAEKNPGDVNLCNINSYATHWHIALVALGICLIIKVLEQSINI